MRTREEKIKPWGYISPFAIETLRDRARCDLTITRKKTHNITMPLYTEEQLREAERRAEQRVRAEIGRDSERLDNIREKFRIAKNGLLRVEEITGKSSRAHQAADRALMQIAARSIDAAREVG